MQPPVEFLCLGNGPIDYEFYRRNALRRRRRARRVIVVWGLNAIVQVARASASVIGSMLRVRLRAHYIHLARRVRAAI